MTGAVIVVSYGSTSLLEAGLVGLARDAPDLQVVVVDSWSGDHERHRVRALAESEGWHLVAPDRNTGFGAGADLGVDAAERAGCDAVVLLNPDARADPSTVRDLLRAARAEPDLLLSPLVSHPDGSPWFVGGRLDLRTGRTSTRGGAAWVGGTRPTARWLSGACLASSVEGWRRRGGFDPRYFLYWEDVELSLRWQRGGGRIAVQHHLQVIHDVGGTQPGEGGKSPLYVRWNCRNRLLLAGQLGLRTYGRWAALAPVYAWEVVRRGGRRRLLRHPQLLGAAVIGTVEGIVVGGREVVGALVARRGLATRSRGPAAGRGGTDDMSSRPWSTC